MFLLYYDPTVDAISQWFVPPGTPLDEAASTLGIVETSLNEFPGVTFGADSPPPPDWNYNGVD